QRQSRNGVTQRSGDTVLTFASIPVTGVVGLFMFVLHPRHIYLHSYIAFLFRSKLHDLVVLVLRQHAYERHHSRHETAPARTQAEVFWFIDHLIHRHHGTFHEGVLRKARHGIRILAHIWLAHLHPLPLHVGHVLVLHRIPCFQRRIRHGLLRRRTDAQSAT